MCQMSYVADKFSVHWTDGIEGVNNSTIFVFRCVFFKVQYGKSALGSDNEL